MQVVNLDRLFFYNYAFNQDVYVHGQDAAHPTCH